MKFSSRAILLALVVAGASAQGLGDATTLIFTGPGPVDMTTTEYYSICTETQGGLITVTGTVTDYYCSEGTCTGGGTPPTEAPSLGYATVYTTVYSQTCSTGLYPVTYTVTEACPCHNMGQPGYIPQGFTTTAVTCTTCGAGTLTATLTVPVASATGDTSPSGSGSGSAGSPAGPANPGASGSGSNPMNNLPGAPVPVVPVPASRAGGSPAGPTAPAGGPGAGGASNGTAPAASVPAAGGSATGSSSTGPGSASGPQEFRGAASSISIEGFFFTSLALMAGVFAWML